MFHSERWFATLPFLGVWLHATAALRHVCDIAALQCATKTIHINTTEFSGNLVHSAAKSRFYWPTMEMGGRSGTFVVLLCDRLHSVFSSITMWEPAALSKLEQSNRLRKRFVLSILGRKNSIFRQLEVGQNLYVEETQGYKSQQWLFAMLCSCLWAGSFMVVRSELRGTERGFVCISNDMQLVWSKLVWKLRPELGHRHECGQTHPLNELINIL